MHDGHADYTSLSILVTVIEAEDACANTVVGDINDDGLVDNSDLEILVSYVIEQSTYGDINQNSNVDIFDLFTLADFLYSYWSF